MWTHLDCVISQSEDDFLEESDFDDISIHSVSVLSDALGAAAKKKSKSGRKKKKSRFRQMFLWTSDSPLTCRRREMWDLQSKLMYA